MCTAQCSKSLQWLCGAKSLADQWLMAGQMSEHIHSRLACEAAARGLKGRPPASVPTQVDISRREEVSVGFRSCDRSARLKSTRNCLNQLRQHT